MNVLPWRCPVCHASLTRIERSYICPARHSYDLAKENYVNLLLVNRKHSADPGDSKEMLLQRRHFLQQGYYAPLANSLSKHIRTYLPDTSRPMTLLDAGCGEGYYLGQLAEQLGTHHHFIGTDISRAAMRMIARRYPHMHFAVASSFDLPLPDESVDVLIRIFAPASDEEMTRVLKPGGLYIRAHPGAQHLFELRALIYDAPQLHNTDISSPPCLILHGHHPVSYPLNLPDQASVSALLAMTPYYWAATEEKQAHCLSLPALDVSVDFCVTVMQKSG